MTPQLALFSPDAEAQRCLREELDSLGAAYGELQDRYTALWQEARDLRAALTQAQRQVEHWKAQAASWEQVARWTPRPRAQDASPGPTLEPLLKQLLTLCHPDKWSAGQPATALAHELSIAINALREGRPA